MLDLAEHDTVQAKADPRESTLAFLDHNSHVPSDTSHKDQLLGKVKIRNLREIVEAPSPTSGFFAPINWVALCSGGDSHALILESAILIREDEVCTRTDLISAAL
jgi:hypothetical protein